MPCRLPSLRNLSRTPLLCLPTWTHLPERRKERALVCRVCVGTDDCGRPCAFNAVSHKRRSGDVTNGICG